MKRTTLIMFAALVTFSLSGCFSTGFMGFLATTEQVDKKLAEQEVKASKEIEAQKAEIEAQKEELAKVQASLADVQAVKDLAQATVDELRDIAKRVEGKITTLPKETLQKLVEILQTALAEEGQ